MLVRDAIRKRMQQQVTETWDLSSYGRLARTALDKLFGTATQKALEQTMANLKRAAEEDVAAQGA